MLEKLINVKPSEIDEKKSRDFHELIRDSRVLDDTELMDTVLEYLRDLGDLVRQGSFDRLREELPGVLAWFSALGVDKDEILDRLCKAEEGLDPIVAKARTRLLDLINITGVTESVASDVPSEADAENVYRGLVEDCQTTRRFSHGSFFEEETCEWAPSRRVFDALWAIKDADSVTCDPQKMGYLAYPCGIVLFRDNRVRACVRREVSYITAAGLTNANIPPRHPDPKHEGEDDPRIHVDGFGPFILEGSRPGAAACALKLSLATMPPTRSGHGRVVRATLLAARELYWWLVKWSTVMERRHTDAYFRFVPISTEPPDTNVITFMIGWPGCRDLRKLNELTEGVYSEVSIQTELGEREHSYSQPFFVSHTELKPPFYTFELLTRDSPGKPSFFNRAGLSTPREDDFNKYGVFCLRATVMNPYLDPIRTTTNENLIRDFVQTLAENAGAIGHDVMR